MSSNALNTGFKAIGFDKELDECFFLCESKNNVTDLHIKFHLDTAQDFDATGVFFQKELDHYYNPQIYIYDYTGKLYNENELTSLQKKVWSSGNIPLVCVFYDTEIKIIDCTTHVKNDKPVLLETISLINKVKNAYDELFAVKIKTGVFWEEAENKNKFNFKNNSSYNILINWIKELRKEYAKLLKSDEIEIINKVIIQSILIKYLEERKDENGLNLFQDKYFKEYNNASTFVEVLNNNDNFIHLLGKLQKDFNGNVFEWNDTEKGILKKIDLTLLSKALNGYVAPNNREQMVLELIRYYEFSYVPVELISRLYEEFLGEDKRNKGLYYTPSHLARLLVDESMPLKNYDQVDLSNYKVLDPACGSGIFLVFAFKRLVQWWRLQQNSFDNKPKLSDLKKILACIYGSDKEKQATTLAAFSLCLALCDELSPLQIITELQFDDLTNSNILHTDFFIDELVPALQNNVDFETQKKNYAKLEKLKFDLIIGNPPFRRSGDLEGGDNKFWKVKIADSQINIPSKQIALKFLSKSFSFLHPDGLQCLIVKSAALLYNPTAIEFKKILFSSYNVEKIFDFTALARNGVLWDNGAEVDTIAIFTKKQLPDNLKNILHLTFRRTKSIKERLSFDIDDYDRHFVNRHDAINNQYIWKNNLIGGGRVRTVVDKLSSLNTLKKVFEDDFIFIEGESGAKSLDNDGFETDRINKKLFPEGYYDSFKNIHQEKFTPPNILIKENITLPFSFNNESIPYSNEVVGIYSAKSEGNRKRLSEIRDYFSNNLEYLKFYIIATSSKALVYKNTAVKKEDIENLPYYEREIKGLLSDFDTNVIADTLNFYQYFLRNGEGSKAVMPIPNKDLLIHMQKYGEEFCRTLNLIYGQEKEKFRLSDIIPVYGNSYLAAIFKYDEQKCEPVINSNPNTLNIGNLTINKISSSLTSTRIIKAYEENTIIFIKPNQYRYWLSSIAYRDADKCVVDLSKAGY
ncbi:N-6 DNA methylase [Bacteroides thetaiotaomicron]|uniref:HsdM family class I SAM-dependent methyltransferase n=1 Tax=Bacteroides thetaiotaomicron TaxID=818 RepID=UPI001C033D58|nr:N-6 DNA methylase [Bacteroides thetaiotaomicron]MBT9898386.1 N-6 DNA methylase [Bacteroides thetaiotaomicron]